MHPHVIGFNPPDPEPHTDVARTSRVFATRAARDKARNNSGTF